MNLPAILNDCNFFLTQVVPDAESAALYCLLLPLLSCKHACLSIDP